MGKRKKVCLITPNHISSNPRLIKEATSLDQAGYLVYIIFTQNLDYLSKQDDELLRANPNWKYFVLDWTTNGFTSKIRRYRTGLINKLLALLPLKLTNRHVHTLLVNRHYYWQTKMAIKTKSDLYIAHNLGALPVAVRAAQHHRVKAIFDAEDFHRHELSDDPYDVDVCRKKAVEDIFIPKLKHATAASPLIAEEYRKLYPSIEFFTIRNVFPQFETHEKKSDDRTLRLFWFSQKVGLNRGVQDVIKALKIVEEKQIELHIYGFLPVENEQYFQKFISDVDFKSNPRIFFHKPVSPDEILRIASSFDIGLALEPGFSINNKIALSNKIFTYLVGGSAILFSRTPAQAAFFNCYNDIGFLYNPGDAQGVADILDLYYSNPHLLKKHQEASKMLYRSELNWSKEQLYFLTSVQKGLN